MGNKVTPRPEYLISDKELKEQGYKFPNWEKDHEWVSKMIEDAFPEFHVYGSEDKVGIYSTLLGHNKSEIDYISKISMKDENGNSYYEIANIYFTNPRGSLRSDVEIFVNFPHNRRQFANVDWDEKIDYSLHWSRGTVNRAATLHKDTVENIIEYLREQFNLNKK